MGNSIYSNGRCAPVDVDWEVFYTGVYDSGTGNVLIQYDWNDGSPFELVNATYEASADRWVATHSHTYPNAGYQCNYYPRTTLVVNGTVCSSIFQEQLVTVWDTDDRNGGHLSIDPAVKPMCVGDGVTFNFYDVSQWNCTPPEEVDVINNENRWIQWVYGTGGTDITDALVGGVVRSDVWSGPIESIPGPVEAPLLPSNTSLEITIPDHHPVGAFFEVTLRNWNTCNPYDDPNIPGPPVDLINGDYAPVQTTAMVIVSQDCVSTSVVKPNEEEILIHSNSSKDKIAVHGNFIEGIEINIYNLSGKKVFGPMCTKNSTFFDISSLGNGFYIIEIIDSEKNVRKQSFKYAISR
jgi:hypothetical protein